jgi:hypothetical protein
LITKGGRPQFKSAPPQLRNIADNQIDCGVAKKVAGLQLRTFKIDFRTSATFRSLLPILPLSSPFSSAQDGLKKSTIYIFRTVCFSGNQKLALKGQ